MERAVVAAKPIPERDDAQRADLVTARAWENHRCPRLAVERLGADGTLEVQALRPHGRRILGQIRFLPMSGCAKTLS